MGKVKGEGIRNCPLTGAVRAGALFVWAGAGARCPARGAHKTFGKFMSNVKSEIREEKNAKSKN